MRFLLDDFFLYIAEFFMNKISHNWWTVQDALQTLFTSFRSLECIVTIFSSNITVFYYLTTECDTQEAIMFFAFVVVAYFSLSFK